MNKKRAELGGKRFGKLVAVSYAKLPEEKEGRWLCKCDCGAFIRVITGRLTHGGVKSCGCVHYKDLTGMRFGKLVVLERAPGIPNRAVTRYWCRCDCGNKYICTYPQLIYYGKTSCGGCE